MAHKIKATVRFRNLDDAQAAQYYISATGLSFDDFVTRATIVEVERVAKRVKELLDDQSRKQSHHAVSTESIGADGTGQQGGDTNSGALSNQETNAP
jgi:hypothetical protein